MTATQHIRNPIEWGRDTVGFAEAAVGSAARAIVGSRQARSAGRLVVHQISPADLWDVLAKGLADFAAYRTDVVFYCLIYPVAGLVLAQLAAGQGLWPLVFPLASGFALIGPVAAIGLYEMSRRREQGAAVSWTNALEVVRSPALGAIIGLGLVLLAIFLLWLAAANSIYAITLGPQMPSSLASFLQDVFTTPAGWALIGLGVGTGFLFAVVVLTISVVSFPLLLDRDVGIAVAILTSVRTVVANPRPMALWGLIVAGGLVVGSIPFLIGLAIVLPILGHATWHLYRKVVTVERDSGAQTESGHGQRAGAAYELPVEAKDAG